MPAQPACRTASSAALMWRTRRQTLKLMVCMHALNESNKFSLLCHVLAICHVFQLTLQQRCTALACRVGRRLCILAKPCGSSYCVLDNAVSGKGQVRNSSGFGEAYRRKSARFEVQSPGVPSSTSEGTRRVGDKSADGVHMEATPVLPDGEQAWWRNTLA